MTDEERIEIIKSSLKRIHQNNDEARSSLCVSDDRLLLEQIDILTERVIGLEKLCLHQVGDVSDEEIENKKLKAENARLREALREARDSLHSEGLIPEAEYASKALKDKKNEIK